jgi:hypothetical protein
MVEERGSQRRDRRLEGKSRRVLLVCGAVLSSTRALARVLSPPKHLQPALATARHAALLAPPPTSAPSTATRTLTIHQHPSPAPSVAAPLPPRCRLVVAVMRVSSKASLNSGLAPARTTKHRDASLGSPSTTEVIHGQWRPSAFGARQPFAVRQSAIYPCAYTRSARCMPDVRCSSL